MVNMFTYHFRQQRELWNTVTPMHKMCLTLPNHCRPYAHAGNSKF